MKVIKEFTKGLWTENPVFVMVLAICPTLATTTNLTNALCMGGAATIVAVGSNCVISLIRNFIPGAIRIPCYIVVIASFVTVVDLSMHAYLPTIIYETLGIFVPLIVVNCIMLGRAEAFASRHGLLVSFMDGLGMGLGFTLALCMVGFAREILGNGTIFNYQITEYFANKNASPCAIIEPISILAQPSGAFLVIGSYLALFKYLKDRKQERKMKKSS